MPKNLDEFLDELKVQIRGMTPQSRVYRVLRDELGAKGYWRRRARGNPKLGFKRMQEVKKQKQEAR
jgi:hypothetical protein